LTSIHVGSHLAQIFLAREIFQAKFVDKIKTQTLYSITFFFLKSCRSRDIVEKSYRTGKVTYDNTAHAHWMLGTQGYKHTLRICSSYCLSSATMAARTRLNPYPANVENMVSS